MQGAWFGTAQVTGRLSEKGQPHHKNGTHQRDHVMVCFKIRYSEFSIHKLGQEARLSQTIQNCQIISKSSAI